MDGPRNAILTWAEQGRIDRGRVDEAMRIADALPAPRNWRVFIDRFLLWSGTVLIAVGVIFFFAANWSDLGRFARFGIVELLVAAALLGSARLGFDTPAGKASLLAASLLTGALLALFGQTYQTGADTFELFALWALCIFPWVAVARLPALWFLLITLLNLAIIFYFRAFSSLLGFLFGTEKKLWVLFAFNAAVLALWEIGSAQILWLRERWAPRLVAFAGGGLITTLAIFAILDWKDGVANFPVYLLWVGAFYVYYRHYHVDLFMLAGGALSVIIVLTTLLGKALLEHGTSSFDLLVIGLSVIAFSGLAGWWLRIIGREESNEE